MHIYIFIYIYTYIYMYICICVYSYIYTQRNHQVKIIKRQPAANCAISNQHMNNFGESNRHIFQKLSRY